MTHFNLGQVLGYLAEKVYYFQQQSVRSTHNAMLPKANRSRVHLEAEQDPCLQAEEKWIVWATANEHSHLPKLAALSAETLHGSTKTKTPQVCKHPKIDGCWMDGWMQNRNDLLSVPVTSASS